MKKPTEQELKEICEKFKFINLTENNNEEICLQKRFDDYCLTISLEISNEEIYWIQSWFDLDTALSSIKLENSKPEYLSLEHFILMQLSLVNEQMSKYYEINLKLQSLKTKAKCDELNIEFVKAIVQGEVDSW